ncbi:bifunctional diaminohydroxyphosphoribosylaminopyrimidine deaminase/5-amino-6-(5-phosphoribosylamino)uracil reductase RibD [Amycolatopsis sp. cmx-4-54]|uniref:bifunctional diaminohydroxyphosphoribosylaminopyrimidine deaminase/5-amino-6-(5-phosphoribosylamino)uracil reductase RibD n=1 Tax=Amycolatopsis sp. cmx-4-54 TaxID=2790936 RepID=UPI00397A700F
MRRAIALSAKGLGTTSPNPPVGCVILDPEGQLAGEGFHLRKGEPHAEVNALAAAGDNARGGTAVVTLEPCNHHGRTPPCRQALLDAGVTRVVIALMDPTSREEGGASRLRSTGVDVEDGVLGGEALLVVGPWMRSLETKLPFVRLLDDYEDLERSSEFAYFRSVSDAVIFSNGRVEEGASGVHLPEVFALPTAYGGQEPELYLRELYTGGVRSLLLVGRSEVAKSFCDAGLVDEIVQLIDDKPDGAGAAFTSWVDTCAASFEVNAVEKGSTGVRMVLARRKDGRVL